LGGGGVGGGGSGVNLPVLSRREGKDAAYVRDEKIPPRSDGAASSYEMEGYC